MYLEVKDLTVIYDTALVLNKVKFSVDRGELVCIVGPNGAGKSTLLRAIAGLVKWEIDTLKGTTLGKITFDGSVMFAGEEVIKTPVHQLAKKGIILCPERGRPFREMTVWENLKTGAYLINDKKVVEENMGKIFELFPVLKNRRDQIAGTLSGGERTMLSIGRSLMAKSDFLLIDEPSVGLAPKIKEELFERIKDVHGMGITILMVEQDVSFAFDLSIRNYVLSQGKIIAEGTGDGLMGDDIIRKTYLGL